MLRTVCPDFLFLPTLELTSSFMMYEQTSSFGLLSVSVVAETENLN